MKPAAEDAAQILVHYLRHAAKGTDLGNPDTFAEVEGVMQGLIDEAGTAQKEYRIATAKLFLRVRGDIEKLRIEIAALKRAPVVNVTNTSPQLPDGWNYTPPVKQATELPPLGPTCARPEPPLRQGKSKQAPVIAGVPQLFPGPYCLQPDECEGLEDLPSDRLSHVHNCKFCKLIMLEKKS